MKWFTTRGCNFLDAMVQIPQLLTEKLFYITVFFFCKDLDRGVSGHMDKITL